MRASHHAQWLALLISGPSRAGKARTARTLGTRLGVPWLPVDDLRLALQRSQATLPHGTGVRAVFLVAPDESALHANAVARNRVIAGRTEARAMWLVGVWQAAEL